MFKAIMLCWKRRHEKREIAHEEKPESLSWTLGLCRHPSRCGPSSPARTVTDSSSNPQEANACLLCSDSCCGTLMMIGTYHQLVSPRGPALPSLRGLPYRDSCWCTAVGAAQEDTSHSPYCVCCEQLAHVQTPAASAFSQGTRP